MTRRAERILALAGTASLTAGLIGLLAYVGPALDAGALLDGEHQAAQLTADHTADALAAAARTAGRQRPPKDGTQRRADRRAQVLHALCNPPGRATPSASAAPLFVGHIGPDGTVVCRLPGAARGWRTEVTL